MYRQGSAFSVRVVVHLGAGGYRVIDQGIQQPWPDEVLQAVEPFEIGHLIEEPPFFYVADLRYPVWGLTRNVAEEGGPQGVELVELDPEDGPEYGAITSQTCDVTEAGVPNPAQPWFQVCPVYRWPGDTPPAKSYLAELTAPDMSGYVADLRLELTLEKSFLVGRQPIAGFATEDDQVSFADRVGRRRARAALADAFHDVLEATMRQRKQQTSSGLMRRVRHGVFKLMLAIPEGTRLKPGAAKLYVIANEAPSQEIKDWFDEWWDDARQVAESHGLNLLENAYWDARAIDLRTYVDLIEIHNPLG